MANIVAGRHTLDVDGSSARLDIDEVRMYYCAEMSRTSRSRPRTEFFIGELNELNEKQRDGQKDRLYRGQLTDTVTTIPTRRKQTRHGDNNPDTVETLFFSVSQEI